MIFNGKLNSTTKRRFLSITIALLLIGTGIYLFNAFPHNECKYDGMNFNIGDRHPQTGCRCDPDGGGWICQGG